MSPSRSKKQDLSPLVEGTLAVPSEFLEFYGDHAHIYNMGWKKKKSETMFFISSLFEGYRPLYCDLIG